MSIHQINSNKLKRQGEFCSLWYQFDEGDLYILLGQKHIEHFEFTKEDKHLEGGRYKDLRFGLILENTGLNSSKSYKASRLVEYVSQESFNQKHFAVWAQHFIHNCPDVEAQIKEGIMEFLVYGQNKANALESKNIYLSYHFPQSRLPKQLLLTKIIKVLKYSTLIGLVLLPLIYFLHFRSLANNQALNDLCKSGNHSACQKILNSKLLSFNRKDLKELRQASAEFGDFGDKNCQKRQNKYCTNLELDKIPLSKIKKNCLSTGNSQVCQKLFDEIFRGSKDLVTLSHSINQRLRFFDQVCGAGHKQGCIIQSKLNKFAVGSKSCLELESLPSLSSEFCLFFANAIDAYGQKKISETIYNQICKINNKSKACYFIYRKINVRELKYTKLKSACVDGNIIEACFDLRWEFSKNGKLSLSEKLNLKKLYKNCLAGNESSCQLLK